MTSIIDVVDSKMNCIDISRETLTSSTAVPEVKCDKISLQKVYPENPSIKIDWLSYSDLEIPKEIWALAKGTGYKFTRIDESKRLLRTTVKVQNCVKKSLEEHVYFVPETYIGSVEPSTRSRWLFNVKNKTFYSVDINISSGCECLFQKVISDYGCAASRINMIDSKAIDVTMNHQTIRVRNYATYIPIVLSDDFVDHYVPEINILLGRGTGGYLKLINIFSKGFMIRIADNINKKLIVIVWLNNMTEMPYFHLQNYSGPSYVESTYTLDFDRFDMKEYSDKMIDLFSQNTLDFSLLYNAPVAFNGVLLNYRNILDYRNSQDYLSYKPQKYVNKNHLQYVESKEGDASYSKNFSPKIKEKIE